MSRAPCTDCTPATQQRRIRGDTDAAHRKSVRRGVPLQCERGVHLSAWRKGGRVSILRACVCLSDSSKMEDVSHASVFTCQALQELPPTAVGHRHCSAPENRRTSPGLQGAVGSGTASATLVPWAGLGTHRLGHCDNRRASGLMETRKLTSFWLNRLEKQCALRQKLKLNSY